jgi:DNA repair protein RadC
MILNASSPSPKEERRLGILQWASDDRPREKLLTKGRSHVSDAELLAILIGSGSRNETALDLAHRILAAASHNLDRLAQLGAADLLRIRGIGPAKAVSILAALELGRRRSPEQHQPLESLSQPERVYQFMRAELADLQVEQFWLVLLDNSLKPIKKIRISEGGISAVMVDIRVVFGEALRSLASAIVVVHNHPSGKLEPSEEDIKITRRISAAADVLQLRLIDHLIWTNIGFYSFAVKGCL